MRQKIDLKIIKTERLHPEEINSLFIPVSEFDKIIERDNVFIIGPKGSGKSMILNYLSFPVQLDRFKRNEKEEYDKSNLGLYLRCNEHFFGGEKIEGERKVSQYWRQRFIHLFNLTATEKLLMHLSELKKYPLIRIEETEEASVCKELGEIFQVSKVTTFDKLRLALREKIHHLSKDKSKQKKHEVEFTELSFLAQLQNTLQENISDFDKRMLVILLDEYQILSTEQQRIVSEILSIRKPLFKIASLPLGFTIERLRSDRSLDLEQDFQTVNLGTHNLTPESPEVSQSKRFLIDMANRRLKNFDLNVEDLLGHSISFRSISKEEKEIQKPVYAGLEDYVVLSSGNPKHFLDLLKRTLSKWNNDHGIPIPVSIQDSAIREFAKNLMDAIEYAPGLSAYVIRSVIQKIGLFFVNYGKETGQFYLQIGIKDPQNLSEDTIRLLNTAFQRGYLMAPVHERVSREGFKLLSIALHNNLLPYFNIPLQTHQVRELPSEEIEKLVNRKSEISGTKIKLEQPDNPPVSIESLEPYQGTLDKIAEFMKKKECVFFIGSGVSAEVGYPTGSQLASMIAKHFNLLYAGEDLPTITERALADDNSRGDIVRYISSVFSNSEIRDDTLFRKLAELGVEVIFTTNWDTKIEEGFKTAGHPLTRIIRDSSISVASSEATLLYKIHGDFEFVDEFVITHEDTSLVESTRPLIFTELRHYLAQKHFVFIGYGMNDWDFQSVRNLIRSAQGKLQLTSYATIFAKPESEETVLRSKNIIPLRLRASTLIDALHTLVNHK